MLTAELARTISEARKSLKENIKINEVFLSILDDINYDQNYSLVTFEGKDREHASIINTKLQSLGFKTEVDSDDECNYTDVTIRWG